MGMGGIQAASVSKLAGRKPDTDTSNEVASIENLLYISTSYVKKKTQKNLILETTEIDVTFVISCLLVLWFEAWVSPYSPLPGPSFVSAEVCLTQTSLSHWFSLVPSNLCKPLIPKPS